MIINLRATNGCLVGGTLIDCPRDLSKYPRGIPIRELVGKQFFTYSWDDVKNTLVLAKVVRVWRVGRRKVYRVPLTAYPTGKNVIGVRSGGTTKGRFLPPCELLGTHDHLIKLCDGSWKKLGELEPGDSLKSMYRREADRGKISWSSSVKTVQTRVGEWQVVKNPAVYFAQNKAVNEQQFVCIAVNGPRPKGAHVHHKDDNKYNHTPSNLEWKDASKHASDHLRERNLRGPAGWKKSGIHPRGFLGKHHSIETKQKISATWRGKALNHKVASSPEFVGVEDVYDMEVKGTSNFVANGVFVHNSGKSYIIAELLTRYTKRRIYGVLGPRLPEAYELLISGSRVPVFILGPYNTDCGGCDRILPFDLIPPLIEKYAAKGHVIFEGLLISTFYGCIGDLMEKWGKESVFLFLDTPLEECIQRVNSRRYKRGDTRNFNPKLLTDKYNTILKVKEKIDRTGLMRTGMISSENAIPTIMGLLKGAKWNATKTK